MGMDLVPGLASNLNPGRSRFCSLIFLQRCETKSGTESLHAEARLENDLECNVGVVLLQSDCKAGDRITFPTPK